MMKKENVTKIIGSFVLLAALLLNLSFVTQPYAIPDQPVKYEMKIKDGCTNPQHCWRRCEPCSVVQTGCECDVSLQHECMTCVILE